MYVSLNSILFTLLSNNKVYSTIFQRDNSNRPPWKKCITHEKVRYATRNHSQLYPHKELSAAEENLTCVKARGKLIIHTEINPSKSKMLEIKISLHV